MTPLLTMRNQHGVVASLLADDAGADVVLTFRVTPPGGESRDEPFGPEAKTNGSEILELIDGLRDELRRKGFTDVEDAVQ